MFKDCERLEQALLDGTQVTDHGLKHLSGCKRLKVLTLLDTRVTADGVKQFRAALPDCKVTADPKPKK
jgi:hypothetical protein